MTVRVMLFAGLREQMGRESLEHTVPEGTTVAELYADLFPAGPAGRLPVLYALDQEYVPGNTPVRLGAEVALLPPLGGG